MLAKEIQVGYEMVLYCHLQAEWNFLRRHNSYYFTVGVDNVPVEGRCVVEVASNEC
jgi:hypothetical protein